MELRSRFLCIRALLLSTLVAAASLALPATALAQRGDPNVAHVDGYVTVSPDGRCMILKQHDGSLFSLGHRRGLIANDHVRLEGRIVAESRCGAQSGFEVTSVQAIWADDNHRSTYYDHLKDGTFGQWVVRNRPQATDPNDRHR